MELAIAFIAHGVLIRDGKILVLRRRKGRYLGEKWDVPGGTVESNETVEEAIVREFREETELTVKVGRLLSTFENADTKGRPIKFVTVTHLVDLADSDRGDTVVLNPEEHDEYRWVLATDGPSLPLVWHVERSLALLTAAGQR